MKICNNNYSIYYLTFLNFVALVIICIGCNNKRSNALDKTKKSQSLFTLLPPSETNITFSNMLTEGLNTNVLMYEYFYNGGGVAIGDVNGDGLQDVYFSGNMVDNKLYLNRGNMKFEDITNTAGVQGRPGPWKTGVTMADVNGDGKPDMFVCYSGKINGQKRIPQLFINDGNGNNGIPHFSDKTIEYGLNDSAFSNQAYFFDYDKDGDLDMLLINHNPARLSNLNEAVIQEYITTINKQTGTRLFKNSHNRFEDVTKQSGIVNSLLSYNLSAGIADINNDGWQDIYISNDYLAPDYLYINNGDGTFTDKLGKQIQHTSQFSMGNNIADINNDGLPDIFTLDMLPEDNHRQKMLFAPDNYALFNINVKAGFHNQYMRNMLQLNNGDNTFSEIGQLAGISNTDWSWSPLFADYDNDGWQDLFVTNGYLRDYTNMDFLMYMDDQLRSLPNGVRREQLLQILQHMPSSHVKSYLFKNKGDLAFNNVSEDWGIDSFSNSNGAAYADLDNDGDLDLVVNNIDQPAFVYRNESDARKQHFLEITLNGEKENKQGIGTKIFVCNQNNKQYREQMPAKGYQSSVAPVIHVGLGKDENVDSLKIIWPSGKMQLLQNVKANQFIAVNEKDAKLIYKTLVAQPASFTEIKSPFAVNDTMKNINDFKRQPLLPNPMSYEGSCLVKGDINGDKIDDIYIGGSNGKPGSLYLQKADGKFIKKTETCFETNKTSEDVDGLFFDANADGYNDLYVVSGGYDNYIANDSLLQDRLYINDGKGNFTKSKNALPVMHVSKSCVRTADINGDSFPDLFVGGRVVPGQYPIIPQSFLLINDGKAHFKDVTASIAPSVQKIGMVTDALWLDLNNDSRQDLIIVGEWMPISIFINNKGKLENKTNDYFDKNYSGWWNKINVADFNKDGRQDLIIGNLGLNTQCKVSNKQPADLYFKDFDGNGTVDPVLCYYLQGKSYPFLTRDEVVGQLNGMSKKFQHYKDYADATLQDVFTTEQLKDTRHLTANTLSTSYFERGSDGKFHINSLPVQAQFAPVFTITPLDYNKDGNEDVLLCGNINHAKLRFGNYDANYGVLLRGDGKGSFNYITQQQSGFHIKGDVRSVISINNILFFSVSQGNIITYKCR